MRVTLSPAVSQVIPHQGVVAAQGFVPMFQLLELVQLPPLVLL